MDAPNSVLVRACILAKNGTKFQITNEKRQYSTVGMNQWSWSAPGNMMKCSQQWNNWLATT